MRFFDWFAGGKMTTYAEKLKDPRWQKKRLEVLEAAGFACQNCYDSESTLHVHHKAYFKGREPWEYDKEQLAVLCESCHEDHHAREDDLALRCSYLPLDGPWSRDAVASLVMGFCDQDAAGSSYDPFSYYAGAIARGVLHSSSGGIHDFIELAEASETDGYELFRAMLSYLKAKKTASNA